jgi:hypothetical protein
MNYSDKIAIQNHLGMSDDRVSAAEEESDFIIKDESDVSERIYRVHTLQNLNGTERYYAIYYILQKHFSDKFKSDTLLFTRSYRDGRISGFWSGITIGVISMTILMAISFGLAALL